MKNICYLLIFISLLSCDQKRVFDDYMDIDEAIWHEDSVVTFTFSIPDAGESYHIYTNIRNAFDYPYRNLYYQYTIRDTADQVLEQQLKNILLFEAKSGKPLGDGLGDIFDHRQLILEGYQFPYSGDYSIEFQQYMRLEELPLILAVGARVEKVEAD